MVTGTMVMNMTLRDTLRGLLKQAEAKPGEPARVKLAHGLTVSVRVNDKEIVSLQLSRADVFPSTREWKTVIEQWPGQCAVIREPRTIIVKSVYYLIGNLRTAPALIREAR